MTDSAPSSGYSIPLSVNTHISEMKPTDEERLRPNGNSPDQLRFKLTTHGNDEYSAVEMQDENSPNQTTNEAIYSHLDETVGCVCNAFPSSITHLLNIYVLCNQLNTRFVVMFTFWTMAT